MSSTPKRHHIVPQFILRGFANDNGRLWCFRKESGSVFETSPANVFVKKRLYTHQFEDGTTSTHLESELSKIEGRASDIADKIITAARSGSKLGVTPPERGAWLDFLYSQFIRHPAQRDSVRQADYIPTILDQFERSIRPLSAEERARYEDPARKDREAKNAWLDTIKAPEDHKSRVMPVFKSKGIGAVVIRKQSKSFVIGDRPVLRRPSPATSLLSPEVRLLYPISWDIMVEWGLSDGDVEVRTLSDHRSIRTLNERSVRESNIVAGRSEELIRSLSRSKARRS